MPLKFGTRNMAFPVSDRHFDRTALMPDRSRPHRHEGRVTAAVKTDVKIPMLSVTADPRIGPDPSQNMMMAATSVVSCGPRW